MKRFFSKFNIFLSVLLLLGVAFSVVTITRATTPNPGHPWAEVGNGDFVVTGLTATRTFTFPDANATILASNAAVTVLQGGTGQTTANAAFNALAPSQTSNSGKFLTTNGTNTSWASIPGGGDALTTNPLSQFAATTSAQLAGVITNATGTGLLFFGTSPTLAPPVINELPTGTRHA